MVEERSNDAEQCVAAMRDDAPSRLWWCGVSCVAPIVQLRLSIDEASTLAPQVDLVLLGLTLFSLFFIFTICGLILYFMAKYRAGAKVHRPTIKHPVPYEVAWVVTPTLIALGLFVWAAQPFIEYGRPPDDASVIYVVGRQWMWKIQHPGGQREINTLHIPVGQPIKLVMTSQDVIHSFYIPAFREKRDVLPNRYTVMWFKATKPGTYHLFCAEYCGLDHSNMRGKIVVMPPAQYERWLSANATEPEAPVAGTPGAPGTPLALGGKSIFYNMGCNACHVPNSEKRAPRLDGLYGRPVRLRNDDLVVADEGYIRESILQPNAKIVAGYDSPSLMPSYQGQVDEEDIRQLIEFIKSIQHGWPAQSEGQNMDQSIGQGQSSRPSQTNQTPNQNEKSEKNDGAPPNEGEAQL